ncbi:PTS glucose transporter subunit IIA [Vagococcus sp. BWB3-3]|uniref:PTS glucose transporter subunit IIA n=1 Tax=Vagococcus allomyrinae TaxID=2794353 RepID=A0A940SRT4_9ENTE|nr:PTS glucose transporter subunit IIA [Vagococcus allomyrinae]MBP1041187.1 PTS glucose transporter subunit IIA [Vagococcus allomyrinae]
MFKFLKKDNKTAFHAVAKGNLIPINKVEDNVFSEKMLGDGFAVQPASSEVFAPVKGKIVSVFPTKHAITMTTDSGLEILVHMGIDTVELKGAPFEIFVKEGQTVTPETKMANMDLDELAKTDTTSTIVVVITNMDAVKKMADVTEKTVNASEEVLTVEV